MIGTPKYPLSFPYRSIVFLLIEYEFRTKQAIPSFRTISPVGFFEGRNDSRWHLPQGANKYLFFKLVMYASTASEKRLGKKMVNKPIIISSHFFYRSNPVSLPDGIILNPLDNL